MIRGRRRRTERFNLPEVSLTPLIDTALTLLVIFMITAPMVNNNGLKVDLPQGDSKEVGTQQELVVTLSKEGKLYFNSFPIERSNLVDSVKQAMNGRENMPVYIRGDKDVSYGKVISVVDTLKLAGIKFVAMSTKSISQAKVM